MSNPFASSQPAGPTPPAFEPEHNTGRDLNKTLLIIAAVLAALAVIIAGATAGVAAKYPAWNSDEKVFANAYPDLFPDRAGLAGYGGTTCHSVEPLDGVLAEIRCDGADTSYTGLYFADAADKDSQMTGEPTPVEFPECVLQRYSSSGPYNADHVLTVPKTQSLFLIDTDDSNFELPLCAQEG